MDNILRYAEILVGYGYLCRDKVLVLELERLGDPAYFLDFVVAGLFRGIGDGKEALEKAASLIQGGAFEKAPCQAEIIQPLHRPSTTDIGVTSGLVFRQPPRF